MDMIPPMPRVQPRPVAALSGIALAAAGSVILYLFDPAQHGFYPICFLHATTGLNCPGCGVMRAIHQLLHGNLVAAAHLNLLFVLCLPAAAWWVIRSSAGWLSGRPVVFAIRPSWLWTFLVVASVFTVLRNLPSFEWLAP
jgi:hypothetical protein